MTSRLVTLLAVVGLVLGAASVPAPAQTTQPQATEVGVTATTIRIAVVADVDNPLQPGLFAGPVAAVRGFANYINQHGGLAGRKVAVDFIDSHLNESEARNAIIEACRNDFALVGTAALFLNNVSDMVSCPDHTGRPVGIPDLAVVTTEVAEQCSPVTFPINPPQLVCSTMNDHPQTYQGNSGPIRYYEAHAAKHLHGGFLYSNDLQSAAMAGQALAGAAEAGGVKNDTVQGISALAPQSGYDPFIQDLKNDKSNYAQSTSSYSSTVSLRKEATLQGLTTTPFVWDCSSACYSQQFLDQGGSAVNGQYVWLAFLPFQETKTNAALANYVHYVGSKVDGFGAYGWGASLLFRDAVNDVVRAHGTNGLTRSALLSALGSITSFNADGMFGTINIAQRHQTPCFVVLQARNGRFVRVDPTKPGTFDCTPSNRSEFKADLTG
jgi:hypothetical protein